MFERSKELWNVANNYMIGGVNSPVRAFKGVGGIPVFIDHAKGARLYDVDGREYCDYIGSWGPMILGHSHPEVVAAIREALEKGTSFGASTQAEIEIAKVIVEMVPSIERVRMVNSGTEATMTAIRLARGYTGRDKIVKFEGCYHGHVDTLLVKAGSGATTLGIPDSKGVPYSLAQDTITLPFNDIDSVKNLLDKRAGEIAAIILEPVPGNMGVVPPEDGYLEELRDVTRVKGVLLIFDEVMTGFRLAGGGAQEVYSITPDITCLGKIIGGGMPVGAVGGKRGIMEYLAPMGPVYQAGTLSGNPIAVAAGRKTLEIIRREGAYGGGIYGSLEEKGRRIATGLKEAADAAGVAVQVHRAGSMVCPFFTTGEVKDYKGAKTSNTEQYARFFWKLLQEGIYVPPSQFEAHFISFAHTGEDIDRTIGAFHKAMKAAKG